jgi:hypothetical protein
VVTSIATVELQLDFADRLRDITFIVVGLAFIDGHLDPSEGPRPERDRGGADRARSNGPKRSLQFLKALRCPLQYAGQNWRRHLFTCGRHVSAAVHLAAERYATPPTRSDFGSASIRPILALRWHLLIYLKANNVEPG